jgi:hypothetical protein
MSYKIESKILYLLIALYPIFAGYSFYESIPLGTVVLSIVSIAVFLKNRNIVINTDLISIIIYIIFLNLIIILINPNYLESTIIFKNIISYVLLVFILVCIGKAIDVDKMYIIYRIIAYICIAFIAFQYISVNYLNTVMPDGRIPLLTSFKYAYISFRPASFFLEPSYFAMYILPIVGLAFNKKDWALIIFSFVGIFISTSRLGIIIFIIILIYNIFVNSNNKDTIIQVASRIVAILMIYIVISTVLNIHNTSTFQYISTSISKIDPNSDIRLFQGLNVYLEYPFIEKIIGVGIGNTSNYIYSKGIFQNTGIEFYNWSNTIFTILLTSGLVGGLLYLKFIINLFKNINKEYLILPIIFLLFNFADSIFINQNFVFIMLIINSVIKERAQNFKRILL